MLQLGNCVCLQGCDASVFLDADEFHTSEREAPPNLSLKGFEVINAIKLELENICPGIVSCSDLLAMATRQAVSLAGGPHYHLQTGRKDSVMAFKEISERELPSPQASLSENLQGLLPEDSTRKKPSVYWVFLTSCVNISLSLFCFAKSGRKWGAHSIGITHCTFFEDRLYNFSGTGKPDPQLNSGFLQELKTKCPFSGSASSPSPSPDTDLAPSLPASEYSKNYGMSSKNRNEGVIDLSFNNEGGDLNFGIRYYKRLMENKGAMFSDQQLMGREDTAIWVRAYASDRLLFQRDFAMAMMKLSSYHVLTGPIGQVRTNCSKVLPKN